MNRSNATSTDVAKLANVSQATVSYVLSGKSGKKISEETRDRVLNAAQQLNYTPNHAAQALRTNKAKCIAVRITSNLSFTRYPLILQGIRSYMEQRGYSILMCSGQIQSDGHPDFISVCLSRLADGIIYICSDCIDIPEDILKQIQENHIPLSTIDCTAETIPTDNVFYDYFLTSYLRANRFIQDGFKNLIYIRPTYDNIKERIREQGMRAAAYATEGINLQSFTIPLQDVNHTAAMHNFQIYDFTPEAIFKLKEIVKNAPSDACFVCSAREMQEKVATFLQQQYMTHPEEQMIPWYKRTISYHFENYVAGFEAARFLYETLTNTEGVHKLVLRPILEYSTPDFF